MALNVPSTEVITNLVNKIIENNLVTPDDLNNINRLQKKKQQIFQDWNEWQIANKDAVNTAYFERTNAKFLEDQAEIALDIKIKQAKYEQRTNFVKRLDTYVKALLIFDGKEEIMVENKTFKFIDVCYQLLLTAKKQCIEELELDNRVINAKLNFVETYDVDEDNKYYLSGKQQEQLREKMDENRLKKKSLSNTTIAPTDLINSDINFSHIVGSTALEVYESMASELLPVKEEEVLPSYDELLRLLNNASVNVEASTKKTR